MDDMVLLIGFLLVLCFGLISLIGVVWMVEEIMDWEVQKRIEKLEIQKREIENTIEWNRIDLVKYNGLCNEISKLKKKLEEL